MTDQDSKSGNAAGAMRNSGCEPGSRSQQSSDVFVNGVQILGFKPESHAEKAGMKKGDVIIAYNGIGNLTAEKLAALVAGIEDEGIGPRVTFVRGGQQLSLRLPPKPLGITAVDTTIRASSELMMARDRTDGIVQIIQKVYLAFIVLGVLGAPSLILGAVKSGVDDFTLFLGLLIYSCIYVGLRRRRDWVIPLVVFFSVAQCIWLFLDIMGPAADIKGLILKMGACLGLLFFAYQMSFFCRPEVRALFGDRDFLVF